MNGDPKFQTAKRVLFEIIFRFQDFFVYSTAHMPFRLEVYAVVRRAKKNGRRSDSLYYLPGKEYTTPASSFFCGKQSIHFEL